MKKFKDFLDERCWPGHRPVPGKRPYSKGSCVKEDAVSTAPTNTAGSGAVAGLGQPPGSKSGEPGINKKRNPVIMPMGKRKMVK